MKSHRKQHLAGASVCVGLLLAAPVRAAELRQLEQQEWWEGVTGLPSYVNLFLYVPDQLATNPPIVVAPHHCQGTGPGTFSEMSALVTLADRNGFLMIFPEATGQNCWDAGSERSLQHDGKGDTHAIVQMVRYVLSTYDANANRVYSVGGSSGGIMTEALLGVYPDVFMAGVSLMGVPCGCWAVGYNDVVGQPSNGTGQWSGPCAGGDVTHTGAEWGDLVRSYFPGYSGHRPRLQHWHGTADTVLDYANVAEDIKEWTNVLALNEAPSGTDTPSSGTTRQYWVNPCGYTVYEVFSLSGVGHSVPFDANAVATYFGLDDASGEDPETAACPGAVPGGGSEGGAGGGSGAGGVAGAAAVGGASSAGASTAGGGGSGSTEADGGSAGFAGAAGTNASSGGGRLESAGGATSAGGGVAAGGTLIGSGGAMAAGGALTTGGGGVVAMGGTSADGGTGTTGGNPAGIGGWSPAGGLGGSALGAGAASSALGGAPAGGASHGLAGMSTSAGSTSEGSPSSDGCTCTIMGSPRRSDAKAPLLLAILGLLLGRRQRRAVLRRQATLPTG